MAVSVASTLFAASRYDYDMVKIVCPFYARAQT